MTNRSPDVDADERVTEAITWRAPTGLEAKQDALRGLIVSWVDSKG